MRNDRNVYVKTGDVQSALANYYLEHGKKARFSEIVLNLYNKGNCMDSRPCLPAHQSWSQLSDSEFIEILDEVPIPVLPVISNLDENKVLEPNILPDGCDVQAARHMNYANDIMHSHDYFEVCFVLRGTCKFQFEKERLTLKEGELCVIAPLSMHAISSDGANSVILGISIRKSTFDSAFFSLLSQRDLLSCFFRTQLYNQAKANFLLLFTNNNEEIRLIIKNIFIDCNTQDVYANNRSINWVNILFSEILRNYSHTMKLYNNDLVADFSSILQCIQHNYRTITLKELADTFHYQATHLSRLIKKNTGSNFIDLITSLKMADSMNYLKNTDMSIEKIAEYAGYNSADHFTYTFKKHYKCSPQQYRKALTATVYDAL